MLFGKSILEAVKRHVSDGDNDAVSASNRRCVSITSGFRHLLYDNSAYFVSLNHFFGVLLLPALHCIALHCMVCFCFSMYPSAVVMTTPPFLSTKKILYPPPPPRQTH